MNQGIFGFPPALGDSVLSVTQIDVSGSYIIVPGTKRLIIFAVGGGGGGGAGGKRASGTAQSGGAAGSGGSQFIQYFNVEDLGDPNTTLSIIIGAGGLAGAIAGDTAAGGAGGAGGTTTITPTGKIGTLIHCPGGGGGGGGTNANSTAGAVRQGWFYQVTTSHIVGAGSIAATGRGADIGIISVNSHGGAGGSGLTAAGVAGVVGGAIYFSTGSSNSSIGSVEYARGVNIIGTSSDTVAIVNPNIHINGKMSPGIGGHGGGSGLTSATAGTNGYRGSGAGGGGSTLNTFTAGAGGTGGNGYVCIVALN